MENKAILLGIFKNGFLGQLVPEMQKYITEVEVNFIVDYFLLFHGLKYPYNSKDKKLWERIFYLISTYKFGWSLSVLINNNKANTFQKMKLEYKTDNLETTLLVHYADQVDEKFL